MRNNTTWSSTCETCRATIKQVGSSRPRKYCNARCYGKHPDRLRAMRVYAKKKYQPKNTLVIRRATNKQILVTEKLLRGECALHGLYNNGERKFVVPGLEYLFDMDHVDRTKKHKTIAKMHSDPEPRFKAELVKCQMVCVECHRRKTVEHKDWVSITKPLESMIVKIYNQPSLFDIDPL